MQQWYNNSVEQFEMSSCDRLKNMRCIHVHEKSFVDVLIQFKDSAHAISSINSLSQANTGEHTMAQPIVSQLLEIWQRTYQCTLSLVNSAEPAIELRPASTRWLQPPLSTCYGHAISQRQCLPACSY